MTRGTYQTAAALQRLSQTMKRVPQSLDSRVDSCLFVRVSAPIPHKISTLIYAFNERDELLMMFRRRPPNLDMWSPFGGKLHGDEGESPYQCAARETMEEIGLTTRPADFHLAGMVSEKAYEGSVHWLMFMFELRTRLRVLPPPIAEGEFAFVPLDEVAKRPIPESDRDLLWPLFLKHRGGFFSVFIDTHTDGRLTYEVEETM